MNSGWDRMAVGMVGIGLLAGALTLSGCALHTRTGPLEVGAKAPGFALPDSEGTTWTLEELLARGPAVVIFYRGYW